MVQRKEKAQIQDGDWSCYTGNVSPITWGPVRKLCNTKSSLVAHWLLVTGDHGSNHNGVEHFSSFIFESQSLDCHLPLN